MFSVPALAQRYNIDNERLGKRLGYWRKKRENTIGGDWTEIENRSQNEPKYLYRLGAVLNIVNDPKLRSDH